MFLKYFFSVFDDRKGPGFGSRFMKFLGTTFMGTPASKGLGGLRKDVQESYYWVQGDKFVPKPGKDLDEWRIQQTFVEQYKQVEAPQAALATGIACLALAMACVLVSAPFNGLFKSEGGSTASVNPASYLAGSLGSASDDDITMADCIALQERMARGEITFKDVPKKTVARCNALAKAN